MKKILLFIFYKLFYFVFNIKIFYYLKAQFDVISYKKIKILGKNINFYIPNDLVNSRVNTFYSKEPETLKWIDSFIKKKKIIFWDIGANIGLYSIYNSQKNPKSQTIAFEPSTSNLRTLSRNISINNLQNKILIFPTALTNNLNKNNYFSLIKESSFCEGGALNAVNVNYNFEVKKFEIKNNYRIFSNSISYFIDNNILKIPDYIKIDVDGTEDLILEGAKKYLKKTKSLLIEINENFKESHKKIIDIMKKNGFTASYKTSEDIINMNKREPKFAKSYNYIFNK